MSYVIMTDKLGWDSIKNQQPKYVAGWVEQTPDSEGNYRISVHEGYTAAVEQRALIERDFSIKCEIKYE
jgi:hypothetical protein